MTNAPDLTTPSAVNAAVKTITDTIRRSNCAGAIQYVPELTWMLFLRILDVREAVEEEEAAVTGDEFTPAIVAPYRWRDWGDPEGPMRARISGEGSVEGEVFRFVNERLFPALRALRDREGATERQRIVGEVFSLIVRSKIDAEYNLLETIDRVHALNVDGHDASQVFALSQVYEGLLLKMGEKNNDGGQFFTPREIIRAMVRIVDPKLGQTVYDPCCGTGGFLAQSYEHMRPQARTPDEVRRLKTATFYGREKEDLVVPITLANLVLHGIDGPHVWHGNALTGQASYEGLWKPAPEGFDVILTNPPFGGKESARAQTRFAYRTGATQVLFLQDVIEELSPGGHCGMVIDEGVLFRTGERAYVQTKRKLLDECDLYCIVSLPAGVFVSAGAGVKTDLLFFRKGGPTESVWYYDLSDLKMGKKNPLTRNRMGELFDLLPTRGESERSWSVSRAQIEANGYDLKAVNPHRKEAVDPRTSGEIMAEIEGRHAELTAALERLRALVVA